jgi:predicted PurR-regulated permease PerM
MVQNVRPEQGRSGLLFLPALAGADGRSAVLEPGCVILLLKEASVDEKVDVEARQVQVWTRVILRVLLIILGIAVIAWLLYSLRTILLLLVLSVFFCYLIAPIVRIFEEPIYIAGRELKFSRGAAILMAYVLIGGALFAAIRLLIPVLSDQLPKLAKDLPEYISKGSSSVSRTLEGVDSLLEKLKMPPVSRGDIVNWASDFARDLLTSVRDVLAGALAYLVYLPWLILVPILSFFMLKDASSFAENLVALMPNRRLQRRAQRLLVDVSKTMGAYIRAQITSCLVVGTLATIGFFILNSLLDVPYPAVLGAIAGVLEFIPMVGPLLAIIIGFSLALVIVSFKSALSVVVFLGLLRIAQDYFIYPRIIGHGIRMHPLSVIIAILCGAELDGVVGVFLAIPVVGLFIVGYHHYIAYRRTLTLGVSDTGDLAPPDS